MSKRKQIKSKQLFEAGLALEKSGEVEEALKAYQRAVKTDPLNKHSWNRQMLLYRKSRPKQDEAKLIRLAMVQYQQATGERQQRWLSANSDKVDSSKELAEVLNLLEPTGLPKSEDPTLAKWEARLYLLEYRIRNARRKKQTTKKKKVATANPKIKKQPPKKTKQKVASSKK